MVRPNLAIRQQLQGQTESASSLFLDQMRNPSEVFSVVLLIGGDIVQTAIAQMAGHQVTCVAFSFGWVAYAFNSLRSAFGDGTFMPMPEYDAIVINAKSGVRKNNESWLLARLIRDLERRVEASFETWTEEVELDGVKVNQQASNGDSGLIVSLFEAQDASARRTADFCLWSFFAVVVCQLTVAAIPVITTRDWSIILITAAGTLLAIVTGSVPEWRHEKYACRKKASIPYIITRGNGHKHVFVIFSSKKCGLYLDDLAGAVVTAGPYTRIASVILAVLWVMFLVTAGGIKEDTWYLLLVGAIGMVQNVMVAGLSRDPASHGIPLKSVGQIIGLKEQGKQRPKVMHVLYQLEDVGFDKGIKGVGLAVRREYFPDFALRPDEIAEWKKRDDKKVVKK